MVFRRSGFTGITGYQCRVGADCSTESFPGYLNRVGHTLCDCGDVERVTIRFRLDQTPNDVVLRLARGGNETSVVRGDRKKSTSLKRYFWDTVTVVR